jgi:Smg protein
MKEGVLDILIYLFENYFDAETDDGFEPDRETLKLELEKAGFPGPEVERALCWLEELAADHPARLPPSPTSRAIRVFAALEQARLDTDCRGYLVHLEQVGILSPTQRELVIDRLMALEGDEIDIDKLKWVVLMVLFSQPGQETAFSRMEDLVFEDRSGAIH